MPEEAKDQGGPQAQAQGMTLRMHDQDVRPSYANIFVLMGTRDEMILDFGISSPSPNAPQREANMLVSNRVVMSFRGAKRLAIALSQAIQQHESMFGVIDIEPPPRPQRAERPAAPNA